MYDYYLNGRLINNSIIEFSYSENINDVATNFEFTSIQDFGLTLEINGQTVLNRIEICEVGVGTNIQFYNSIGMSELDVSQSDIDNCWYLSEKCPQKSEEQKLSEAKIIKQQENQQALDVARTSHTFTVSLQNQECEFDTKDKTQSDLNSAAIASSMGQPWLWTTNNRVTLSLTAEDIQVISLAYMQAVNADIAKWTAFEEQIEQAETVEAVENIVIDYIEVENA